MLLFPICIIKSAIYDYTIPRLFETIEDYDKYNPNIYNFDIINTDFNTDRCLNTNPFRFNECLEYSIKKYYGPLSLITTNNPPNKTGNKNPKKSKITRRDEIKYQKFWLECGKRGNKKCADLYNTFKIFDDHLETENISTNVQNQRENTIFSLLRESHDIMYKIGDKKSQNSTTKTETKEEIELRFQKVYQILKPISFLSFEKYIKDHFGSLRSLTRISRGFVEDMIGYRRSYSHELKILLNKNKLNKDLSWMFQDLIYPEVAKLMKDVLERKDEKPDFPINKIYEKLLVARFPYLFEVGFDKKERFMVVKSNLRRGYRINPMNGNLAALSSFDDFYVGDEIFQDDSTRNYDYGDESDDYYDDGKEKENNNDENENDDDDYDDNDDDDYYDNFDLDDDNIEDKASNDNTNKNYDNNDENVKGNENLFDYDENKKVDQKEKDENDNVFEFKSDNQNEKSSDYEYKSQIDLDEIKTKLFIENEEEKTNNDENKDDILENKVKDQNNIENENQNSDKNQQDNIYNNILQSIRDKKNNDRLNQEKKSIFNNNYDEDNEFEIFSEYDNDETEKEEETNDFYDIYIENEINENVGKHSNKFRRLFYDYYPNDITKENPQIIIKRNDKKKSKPTTNFDLFSIFHGEDEGSYLDMSKLRLNEAFELCKDYLQSVKNIESINQSNLTTKIATIYGIEKLFSSENRQYLKQVKIFDVFDQDKNLKMCKYFDEGLYYLTIAAKNGEIRAVEALIFKFILMVNETKDIEILDEYFDLVLNEFSDFYKDCVNKSYPPNLYVHYHDQFNPIVADFFDSIIFFDDTLKDYFQVDKISYLKNFTFEKAAKNLRRFIDSSFLVQSGHLAESSLSCSSELSAFKQDLCRFSIYARSIMCIFGGFWEMMTNPFADPEPDEENEIMLNWRLVSERSFTYSLRVYQTLALSGNREAMWNAQIMMKAAHIRNQEFMQFITDSNETFFLHELDIDHRRIKPIEKLKEETKKEEKEANLNLEEMRSLKYIIKYHVSHWFSVIYDYISLYSNPPVKKYMIDNDDDLVFYEKIADIDPYAAFALAWKKRKNLTIAFKLLDKTQKLKHEAKLAVIMSKMIMKILDFFDCILEMKNSAFDIDMLKRIFDFQKIKSTPYLFDIWLGFGILVVLAFLIYIRIFLYCN